MKKNVYTRPDKPKVIKFTGQREIGGMELPQINHVAIPTVHASTECHVTPPDVAERMAGYLGHVESLLEPSAGTGNLILPASADHITAVEKNYSLCDILQKRTRIQPACIDFLEYHSPGKFDGVLMNPPFGKNQAKHHVHHALECLSPGGILIAIVPVTFNEEVFDGKSIEELPRNTFSTCAVSTKIVMIERPSN